MDRLSLKEALRILFPRVKQIDEIEEITLWDAVGRILAEDVSAEHDQPPFPRSPLDGYAVKSVDIREASEEQPVSLQVLCEVDAGYVSAYPVTKGTAVRIMTGAPIPDGADCVVRQEDTDYGEDVVAVRAPVGAYENYCFRGEDYQAGTITLKKGTVLGPVEIGVAASLGNESVPVCRRPRVAVLTTGDEIVLPGEKLEPGKIYDSNLYMLVTRLRMLGTEVTCAERVGDDSLLAAERIRRAFTEADIVITTGGVSVGKKDIMHQVVELLPAKRLFWGIAMKPGMPTLCAEYEGKLLICLSGNPYGAVVNLEVLVRPLIAEMEGRDPELKKVRAISKSIFSKKSKVTRYVRARYENGYVSIPEGSNASGILSSMCGCNAVIELPEGTPGLEKGDEVWVILL